MVRFGINGFGRIGRLILKSAVLKKAKQKTIFAGTPEVVVVNDPHMSADHIAYLLKYDSTHGPFPCDITTIGNSIKIGGQIVEVTNECDAKKIPWSKNCAKYVVDATGLYTTAEMACQFLRDGIKRVLITAPSDDLPVFIVGVNHECFNNKTTMMSLGSCTTNCLASVLKIVNDNFEIQECLMTVVHAAQRPQTIVDTAYKQQWSYGRGAFQSIAPSSTKEAKVIGRVLPELDGKLAGIFITVPVANGSMIDLTIKLGKGAGYDGVKCKMKEASECHMKGILSYTEDQIVSADVIGNSSSAVFSGAAGKGFSKCFVKLIAFYDNEWAYANRVIDMLNYIGSRENCDDCKGKPAT